MKSDRAGEARGVMSKPFAGVRILDFTRYLAGPYGTYQLALLGADVVKIESHEGDDTRDQLADRTWAERKMAPSFLAVNGNKRSITLDLRKPGGREIVKRLVAGADVVWENFRGGVMDRLGLGYEALSAINPRLIYCSVSGFGQTGPGADDGRLRRQAPGDVGHHVDHRRAGARPDPRRVRDLRHDRRHDGGPGGVERALSAHPHRARSARRRRDAGRGARLHPRTRLRIHRRGHRGSGRSATAR